MARALIIVDLQHDFLPGGALAVPGGDEIVQPIVHRALTFKGLVVGTLDWHPSDHVSFADEPKFRDGSWPKHCVKGTHGARFARWAAGLVDCFFKKGYLRDVEAYSGFDGRSFVEQSLAEWLRSHHVDEVEVVGLALDYCVKATALDAVREGFKTTVPLALTRAVAEDTGRAAVDELRAAGVSIVEA